MLLRWMRRRSITWPVRSRPTTLQLFLTRSMPRTAIAMKSLPSSESLRQLREGRAIHKGGRGPSHRHHQRRPNSKIYAVVDEFCRPWVFVLTPGNTADWVMAEDCVSLIPGVAKLIADKGYDTDAFRSYLKEQGIKPVILGKSNRETRVRYDKLAYKGHNVVERCFCRLKDFPASPRVMTSSPETSSRRFTCRYSGLLALI